MYNNINDIKNGIMDKVMFVLDEKITWRYSSGHSFHYMRISAISLYIAHEFIDLIVMAERTRSICIFADSMEISLTHAVSVFFFFLSL